MCGQLQYSPQSAHVAMARHPQSVKMLQVRDAGGSQVEGSELGLGGKGQQRLRVCKARADRLPVLWRKGLGLLPWALRGCCVLTPVAHAFLQGTGNGEPEVRMLKTRMHVLGELIRVLAP